MPQPTEDNRPQSVDGAPAATAAPDFELSRLAASGPAHPLWQRLKGHSLDDPRDARPLSVRLAQCTGWSAAHTQRVLHEYRRFLYLAVRLQGRVCPSEAVDEAWHAHLLDSSRYFGDFCPRVLQYTLHHVPSRGGADEGARHAGRYRATLLAYSHVFGEPPPADIWPDSATRFDERTRHLSSRTHWAVPKPAEWGPALERHGRTLRVWAVALSLPALLTIGCAQGRVTIQPGTSGADFLKLYLAALVAVVVFGIWRAARGQPASGGPVRSAGLVPVEHAYLAGGALRAVQTGLASLLQRGAIGINDGQGVLSPRELNALSGWLQRRQPPQHGRAAPSPGALFDSTPGAPAALGVWRALAPPSAGAHPLEHALFDAVRRGVAADRLPQDVRPALDSLHEEIHARGLLSSPGRGQRLRDPVDRAHQLLWAGLLVWGVLRIIHGLQHGRPVGLLIVLTVLSGVLLAFFRASLPNRRTREGREVVRRATLALRRRSNLGATDPLMPLALALVGTGALAIDMQPFRDAIAPMNRADNGGSGCGGATGCGGDGDGGSSDSSSGCGGCGGD
ncbi:TIGR04222 domain-containing membrane protein [Ottowia testudinis]|uniref:TIGR04222 domain-containing membrane protein n=1 Tax=Ottowia testudinis TaxID=2816950 RepID=A0A975CF37_9BURK|nr:TIGR04222 domain-containing membrane protein [Ottowia testudinis]QTD45278.1 TIGR04222 domain-containing membrane protein [Ottowia testudinis]